MDVFSKRPLCLSCMIFLTCSVLGYFISGIAKIILVAFAALALIFSLILVIFRYYSNSKRTYFLTLILSLVMIILAFSSSFIFFNYKQEKRSEYYDQEVTVDAVVLSEEYINSFSSGYTLSVKRINSINDHHKAKLECSYPAALKPGDRITLNAIAIEPQNTNGRFNEKENLLSKGIFIIYTSEKEDGLNITQYTDNEGIDSFFANLNYKISSILTQNIEGDAGKLSSALLLGNSDLLPDAITRDFRRAGASHILALSGMHMSLIMGAAMFLLKLIIRNRNIVAAILSVMAIFYLILTGSSVSATRSVIMLLIVYLSVLISGVPDSLTSLSLAGFIILLFSPGAVLDAAFWMSFASTMGIIIYVSPINLYFEKWLSKYDDKFFHNLYKILFSITSAVLTSLAALLPLIITMCIFTKEFSVFSILSSLVLSIPTAAIIILSLIFIPFYNVPYISSILTHIIQFMSDIMIDYCADISELENIVVSLNYPFAVFMSILLAMALLFSFISRRFNPFLSLVPFAICLLIFVGTTYTYESVNKDNVKISYINASSYSDMIVISNQRQAIICDISNGSKTSYEFALDEISEVRATEIKAIVLTRYTHQHNATLYDLFRKNIVRSVWVPHPENIDEYNKLETLYTFANDSNVKIYTYKRGNTIKIIDDVYIEHYTDYIERSSVPIDLIGIYTGAEHLTYVSPAFNESDLIDEAEYHLSRSQYVIFGNRGPKTKIPYEINNSEKLKAIVFADKTRAGFYIEPEFSFTAHYLVQNGEEMEYYFKK